MTLRRLTTAIAMLVAVGCALVGVVALVTDSSRAAAPVTVTGTPASESGALPGADGAAIDLQGIDHADLHADLDSLADAWAVGGGDQGYPFWDQAWRKWRDGSMAGSTFQAYVASYESLLERGSSRIGQVDVATEPAKRVRDALERSLSARRAALSELNGFLTAELEQREDIDGETFEIVRQRVDDQIDLSFREARLAMNSSQALLDAAGQRRIPEDAFL
ncbi:MAG: hypothetical protein H7123_02550 [Thermoleophilia bacterium]|nr:hypothetical protein [Thermoleophilia bacterium]